MYVITGAFGQTGRVISDALLSEGLPIRMIVRRDDNEAMAWRNRGAEVTVVDMHHADALIDAFAGAEAAYLINPPSYMSDNLFSVADVVHTNLVQAANAANVSRVVALSSIGAQHPAGTGNIMTTHDFEQRLQEFNGSCTILRAANFIENWEWSLQPVLEQGILPSMFLPIEHQFSMVSAIDIGVTAARLLREKPAQHRLVELSGPEDYSTIDAAKALGEILNRTIQAVPVPESEWPDTFSSHGFPPVTVKAFCEMMHGFNVGHVAFEGKAESIRGNISLKESLAICVEKTLKPVGAAFQ